MDPRRQQGVEEFGRRPFTIVVADEATRAGGFAFDEAARVAERIPLSALHAVYLVKRGTTLAQMEEIAASLRADTVGRAAALGLHDRLMAVHVRSGDPATEIAAVGRARSPARRATGKSGGAQRTAAIDKRPTTTAITASTRWLSTARTSSRRP